MDTLSSSVSSLKVPTLHSTSRQFYHFRTPFTSQLLPPHFITKPNSISNKTTANTISLKTLNNSAFQPSFLNSSPNNTHQNPATGYAAALVGVAQNNNSLETVQRDVERLSKLLQHEQIQSILASPHVDEEEKGLIVKEVGKRRRFHRLIVRLLKMLIDRRKVTLVNEVLLEFQRIFDELSGTKVVVVSSKKKLEEAELFKIALREQMISGAANVKIRNLVDDRLAVPLFAI